MNPKFAHTHLADPDVTIDKFSGTDPDQDAEPFIQVIERKNIKYQKPNLLGDLSVTAPNYHTKKYRSIKDILKTSSP